MCTYKSYVFLIVGLIICPSRELAKQTYDIIRHYTNSLRQMNCPEIRCCLAIGGIAVSESLAIINKCVFIII